MPAVRVTSASPWHIVLVLDDSGSMSDKPAADLNQAVGGMISELQVISQGRKPWFRVSVIAFGSRPRVLAEFQSEQQIDVASVTTFNGSSGGTDMAAALAEAADLLRRNPGQATDFTPYVFLMSDGAPDDPASAEEAARQLKQLNIAAGTPRLITVGFGAVVDALMRRLASQSELYIKCRSSHDLTNLFPVIGSTVATVTGGVQAVDEAIKQAADESVTVI